MDQTTPSRTSLADLIPLIQNAEMADTRKRDMVSAVRQVGRVLGVELRELPLDPARLRARLDKVSPDAIGMAKARWNNIRSLLGKALGLVRPMQPSRSVAPLSPAWLTLMGRLPENRRVRMLAMVRHLSVLGIGPDSVTLGDLHSYRDAIVNDRLRSKPEATWEGNLWAWNICAREIEGWPPFEIPREIKRITYVMEWEAFPASLKADVDLWVRRQSGVDLSDEKSPPKPLRDTSLKSRTYLLRAAASCLVIMGVDSRDIRSLADVVSLERLTLVLQCLLDRNGQKKTAQVSQMASFLKSVADHWVEVDEADLVAMKRLVSRLSPEKSGMTAKNRARLRPFDDEETVRRYLSLPEIIRQTVEKDKRPAKVKAVLAQMAAALAMLQVAPVRIKNLVGINMHQHLVQRGDRLYLVVEADEVKNRVLIDIELPEATVGILIWYAKNYRPHLERQDNPWLFPGKGTGPKSTHGLGAQISKVVFRFMGIEFNPHLARHIAAKIFLDRNPGQYEVVRLLLSHKDINSTLRAYAGAEQRSALRHFNTTIDGLRTAYVAPPRSNRGRKAASLLPIRSVS